jgi:hypothetical protein
VSTRIPQTIEAADHVVATLDEKHHAIGISRIRASIAFTLCFFFAILVFGCKASLFQSDNTFRCSVARIEITNSGMSGANQLENARRPTPQVSLPDASYTSTTIEQHHPITIGVPVQRSRPVWTPRPPPSHFLS